MPVWKYLYLPLENSLVSLTLFLRTIGCPSSLFQTIRGGGWPVAVQEIVAFSPSKTEMSPLVSSLTISGGTENKNTKITRYSY